MIQGPSRRVTMSLQQPISRDSSVWRLAGLALSLTVVLLSQFVLDGAADASIQHGLLFGGGVGTGLALNAIRSAGQGRA